MELYEARYQAELVVSKLAPWCERIQIAGSIRRMKKEITDIDIVLITKKEEIRDMFGTVLGSAPVPQFVSIVNSWEKVIGEPGGKYTKRVLSDGHKLELSMCEADNFGNILMIRTGDFEFSHLMMKAVLKRGLNQRDGYLYRDDKLIPVKEEREYFEILHLPYLEPQFRNRDSYRNKL